MKIASNSYNDIKAVYSDIFNSKTELSNMPLPGATCCVVAGATTTCCTSSTFAN